jgi:Right handed beta helix region
MLPVIYALPKQSRHRVTCATVVTLAAIVCLFACLAGSASAVTTSSCNLYASTSGSDSNSGTASAPFASVRRLMEKLSAGQTGCLVSGQTFAGFTLSEGQTHGAEGAPITLTSTNPEEPATISGRVVTEKGANWLTFTHLNFIYGQETLYPSPTVGSAHTTWTYDNVSGGDLNICFLTNPAGDSYGTGEYTLIEHDRVHDCGHPVTKAELEAQSSDTYEGRENGWHVHGLYDEGVHTTVRNSYFYNASGVGILLRSGGFATIEHNVIDANGRGVEIGNEGSASDVVAWNIITNTTSPCGREVDSGSHCDTYGMMTNGTVGSGSVFRNNDLYGNEGGNIEPGINSIVTLEANLDVNPLYVNAAAHEYTLQKGSPAAGYGPDTAQPAAPSEPPKSEATATKTEAPKAPVTESPVTPPTKTETPTKTSTPPPAKTGSSTPQKTSHHPRWGEHAVAASVRSHPTAREAKRKSHRHNHKTRS